MENLVDGFHIFQRKKKIKIQFILENFGREFVVTLQSAYLGSISATSLSSVTCFEYFII